MRIDKELISLEGDEIHVDNESFAPKGMIKWILEPLLK